MVGAQQDVVIALIGQSGTGKSKFIHCATGRHRYLKWIGFMLKPRTSKVKYVKFKHSETGQTVVLVDTPGLDAQSSSERLVLASIAKWLQTRYGRSARLAGIVYLHRITDNRMTASTDRSVGAFRCLLEGQEMRRVVLCTSMWSDLRDERIGSRRENELKGREWKQMIDQGAKVLRFYATRGTANAIIDSVVYNRVGL